MSQLSTPGALTISSAEDGADRCVGAGLEEEPKLDMEEVEEKGLENFIVNKTPQGYPGTISQR